MSTYSAQPLSNKVFSIDAEQRQFGFDASSDRGWKPNSSEPRLEDGEESSLGLCKGKPVLMVSK